MEAIIGKDWENKSYLRCLVWEDDELDKMWMIPGVVNYSRSGWNQERPILDKLNEEYKEKINQLMWKK